MCSVLPRGPGSPPSADLKPHPSHQTPDLPRTLSQKSGNISSADRALAPPRPRGRAKDPSLCGGLMSSIPPSSGAGWTLGGTWDCRVYQCDSLLRIPVLQSLRDPDVRKTGQAYCAHPAPGPPRATCKGGDLLGPFCPPSGSPQSCLRALTLVHQGPDILPSALMRPRPLSQVPSFSETQMSGSAARAHPALWPPRANAVLGSRVPSVLPQCSHLDCTHELGFWP